ncbi:hypothetical protein HPB52_004176 [Rhipicephalus sanguineus]|uniref:Protein MMS22-like N-terminal domain-containing protein n=1 Tax=Rhipicephalus sanguineus TaxID=34632 RepID=A0A9D4PLN3_RHISA|nr:hypothetical protein HPB52_004176 [Rhipicephalus sanguineus]
MSATLSLTFEAYRLLCYNFRVADSASTRAADRPSHNRDTEWLDPRELCFCLLDELRLTLRLTGRFSDIPVDKNHCRSNDNRRFHIALEVWWTALRVADIVMSSHLLRGVEISFCDLGGFGQNALFAQVAVLFLADLCCLASRFFQAFWTYVNFVLEVVCPQSSRDLELDLNGFCLSSFSVSVEESERAAFCLWMLSAVAEASKDTLWSAKKESLMRVAVRSCMRLHRVWEPSIDLLQSLLDFFLKNLNDNFLIGSSGVQAFQVICQTSQQMHVRARALVETSDLGARGAENSYELFLMLLAQSLHRQSPEGVTSTWKSLRGRICSRFHAKRVEELTELGLQNCSLLFLVLALSVDLEEPVDRLLSVLALVPSESPVEKLRVALRSLFAVLLLLQASSADLSKVAQRTAGWFFERCVGLGPQSGNAAIQSLRSLLLPVYMEGIREVMDTSSQLDCSEHALLVPEMALLLEQCSTSQQEDMLGTIHEAAEKLRAVHKRALSRNFERTDDDRKMLAQHKAFSDAIFKSTLQFLHKALALPVQAASPATCFTDLAVNITLLALDLPSSQTVPVKANFASLFEHFGYSPHTHPSASGRFLCLVLEDDQACSELESRVANSDARLVQAWLRCCVGVEPPNSEMTRLSRIVLGRKEFANYNSLVGTVVPSDEVTAHDDLAVHFLDCLAQYADIVCAMDGISSLAQLRQSVACYLKDFVAVATAQLRNTAAAAATRDSLGNVYHLCGQLFRLW